MNQGRRNLGFPSNQTKGDDWGYFAGCGGAGGGGCVDPANFSYIYWGIKVNPFSMHNSKLVLLNESFKPYTDSSAGFCDHNADQPRGFDVLLLYKAPISGLDRSKATSIVTIPANITLPYEIEFDSQDIPQPDHPDYERRIWVALDMYTSGLMIEGIAQNTEVMKTLKLNWEGRP